MSENHRIDPLGERFRDQANLHRTFGPISLDSLFLAADVQSMTRINRTFFNRLLPGLGMVAVAIAFGWAVQPSGIEAGSIYRREATAIPSSTAPSLGLLMGQKLSIRVLPGSTNVRYQVLDAEGLVLGTFADEREMTNAFTALAALERRADVPDWDPFD